MTLGMDRIDENDPLQALKQRVTKAFEPMSARRLANSKRPLCCYFNPEILFEEGSGRCHLIDRESFDPATRQLRDSCTSPWMQMSSQLALYRTVMLFGTKSLIDGDRGKRTWELVLRHRATDELVQLGDRKGAFTPMVMDNRSPPAEFMRDVEDLLSLMANPRMPGNYDGTVAGTVA